MGIEANNSSADAERGIVADLVLFDHVYNDFSRLANSRDVIENLIRSLVTEKEAFLAHVGFIRGRLGKSQHQSLDDVVLKKAHKSGLGALSLEELCKLALDEVMLDELHVSIQEEFSEAWIAPLIAAGKKMLDLEKANLRPPDGLLKKLLSEGEGTPAVTVATLGVLDGKPIRVHVKGENVRALKGSPPVLADAWFDLYWDASTSFLSVSAGGSFDLKNYPKGTRLIVEWFDAKHKSDDDNPACWALTEVDSTKGVTLSRHDIRAPHDGDRLALTLCGRGKFEYEVTIDLVVPVIMTEAVTTQAERRDSDSSSMAKRKVTIPARDVITTYGHYEGGDVAVSIIWSTTESELYVQASGGFDLKSYGIGTSLKVEWIDADGSLLATEQLNHGRECAIVLQRADSRSPQAGESLVLTLQGGHAFEFTVSIEF